MYCYVFYVYVFVAYWNQSGGVNSKFWITIIRTLRIYVTKDVVIRDNFRGQQGPASKKKVWTTMILSDYVTWHFPFTNVRASCPFSHTTSFLFCDCINFVKRIKKNLNYSLFNFPQFLRCYISELIYIQFQKN